MGTQEKQTAASNNKQNKTTKRTEHRGEETQSKSGIKGKRQQTPQNQLQTKNDEETEIIKKRIPSSTKQLSNLASKHSQHLEQRNIWRPK